MIKKNIRTKTCGYVFLFYDVNEIKVDKIFKICKKYLIHYQKSVFRGEISTRNLIKLKTELCAIVDIERDFISIVELKNENMFNEEIIGTNNKKNNSIFIL